MKCYAFSISKDELFNSEIDSADGVEQKMLEILKYQNHCIGVWQEPHGAYYAFLFKDSKARNKAFNAMSELYKTCKLMMHLIDLKDGEEEADK